MAAVGRLLVLAVTHPEELRSVINYKLWHDPLHRPEEHPETSRWNEPSMKRCWELLDMTSRSFAAVIKELEGDLCRAVAIFYLVLRGLDTIEDDMTLDHDLKVAELRGFYKRLEQPGWNFTQSGPDEKDRQLLVEFNLVIDEYKLLTEEYQKAIRDVCRQMGRGMAHYATLHAQSNGNFSVDTLASFDLYCHYVAGLVGEGVSRLFSASGKENPMLGGQLTLSNSMGLHLQKTNIMRDFREDIDEGRLFWPKEIWGRYVSRPQELYAPGNEQKARWALTDMCLDAARHSVDALDYLGLLQNQSVFNFCAIPQAMAVATLDECFANPAVLHRNVKIRKSMALQLLMRAVNAREVALIFHHHIFRMHAKALPSDPCFMELGVLCGRIETWLEQRYPTWVDVNRPLAMTQEDALAQFATDARIRQLPRRRDLIAQRVARGQPAIEDAAAAGRVPDTERLTTEDYKMIAMIFGGMLVVGAIVAGGIWYIVLYLMEPGRLLATPPLSPSPSVVMPAHLDL